jgi:hypothetical protein
MTLRGLWVFWGAAFLAAPRQIRQLSLAALPAIVIFNIVQQPDRALWNFAFVVMPAAAVFLDRVPVRLGWTFVIAQTLLNLRFGGQLLFLPPSRLMLLVSAGAAAVIVYRARPAMAGVAQRARVEVA